MRTNKKGQLSIGDAPSVILIVGLVFLMMAIFAFIGQNFGEAFDASKSGSVVNETLTTVTETGEQVTGASACNFQDFSVTTVTNATGGEIILPGNYTTTSTGYIKSAAAAYNNTDWNVTYTYSYSGVACNVTADLQTELADNTSIAGIILTISLIGIVLTVLIGIFVLARARRI